MEISKETESQIRELQLLEQNLQSVLMQKQTFQLELSEIENAIEELGKSGEEVYKIAGNIMVKGSKDKILKAMIEKKDLLLLRIKSVGNQEKSLQENSESLREKVLSKIQQK